MNSTTLRGVFPEQKPIYKRNFIKENVKHIKQMQGLLQNNKIFEGSAAWEDKYRNKPVKVGSTHNSVLPSTSHTRSLPVSKLQLYKPIKKRNPERGRGRDTIFEKPPSNTSNEQIEKSSDRAVQTESPESIRKLYENGTVRYPSPSVLKAIQSKKSPRRREPKPIIVDHEQGDMGSNTLMNLENEELNDSMQRLGINDKHDFIKENILALKNRGPKQDANQESGKPYQKGVLPKYLRDRREEIKKDMENDPDCPNGHVLLPEEERKETLRVLRQSYADRIQELNSMPVRNDTLRMRKRKMEIEEELKKIDEGIKVFQRPKVFVKINA